MSQNSVPAIIPVSPMLNYAYNVSINLKVQCVLAAQKKNRVIKTNVA
jgi:hypothetical protein